MADPTPAIAAELRAPPCASRTCEMSMKEAHATEWQTNSHVGAAISIPTSVLPKFLTNDQQVQRFPCEKQVPNSTRDYQCRERKVQVHDAYLAALRTA